jgi:hypothetical protein
MSERAASSRRRRSVRGPSAPRARGPAASGCTSVIGAWTSDHWRARPSWRFRSSQSTPGRGARHDLRWANSAVGRRDPGVLLCGSRPPSREAATACGRRDRPRPASAGSPQPTLPVYVGQRYTRVVPTCGLPLRRGDAAVSERAATAVLRVLLDSDAAVGVDASVCRRATVDAFDERPDPVLPRRTTISSAAALRRRGVVGAWAHSDGDRTGPPRPADGLPER